MSLYVGTRELSSHLGVSERTIRRYAASGKLPASQFTENGAFIFNIHEIKDAIRVKRKSGNRAN